MDSFFIKKTAKKVGFDLVGITSSEEIFDAKNYFYRWIRKGYHGNLKYMEKGIERRLNPKLVLPSAKSIICLALNYYNHSNPSLNSSEKCTGKVARYARGRDYHKVIEKMLKCFIKDIESECEKENIKFENKYYVDYGPFLERAYAEKAGIGFIGRNKNLITREFGSWVFLSVILTNLELDFDEPAKFGCGTCRACIDACPTKAIEEEEPVGRLKRNTIIDSKKCISYQTIENKDEEIPEEIKTQMQDRMFGCDICQEVCPWNRLPKLTQIPEFRAEQGAGEFLIADEILEMEEEVFKSKFQGSPLLRAKLSGLKRNAKAILDNF